ncbi:MAG: DUF934 domain-containing protein [Beijerinckiaceae bacterium]|nr:DUF934 domain-containing protein [Beijerinckiaceae bacterium]MCI0735978.1 DUF934 domain-containing protein [Beijerinckiaceae bacterium]
MPIFKDDTFVADDWRYLAQGEELPPLGRVILTRAQWLEISAHSRAGDKPLGLLMEPGQDIGGIAQDLGRFILAVVAFPKFTDGRGYSIARQLRGHYGFAGELRASGDILFDQLQLLARCGFDSFDIQHAATIRLLEKGSRPRIEIFYQPGLGHEIREQTRPWARRAQF